MTIDSVHVRLVESRATSKCRRSIRTRRPAHWPFRGLNRGHLSNRPHRGVSDQRLEIAPVYPSSSAASSLTSTSAAGGLPACGPRGSSRGRQVGLADEDVGVESTGSEQRRVNLILPVGRGQDHGIRVLSHSSSSVSCETTRSVTSWPSPRAAAIASSSSKTIDRADWARRTFEHLADRLL